MKYFIQTFGCQMNFSDSERMMNFFEKNNYRPEEKIDQADLIIFNTCGVRQSAENRVFGQIHNLRLKNKSAIIVVTGCLAHRKDVQRKLKGKADYFLAIADFPKILSLAKEKLSNAPTCELPSHYLKLAPKYKHANASVFVPIMTGCNNFCSYCVVPYARGREWSRPAEDIYQEINQAAQNGVEQIVLLGQNVNSYKYERQEVDEMTAISEKKMPIEISLQKHITFPTLLGILAQSFPNITFKFLTSHPKDYNEELIDVIATHANISKDIHLPVQSGSDKILKAMNRPYTQRHYLRLIEKTLQKIPSARFSTDIIIGFPGETEEAFQETIKIFKSVPFFEAFLNKYSPRPGTAAYKLADDIPWEEKKRREKILRGLISYR